MIDFLIKTKKTVFTIRDIITITGKSENTARVFCRRAVKKGTLQRLYAGIYSFPHFQADEFATKVRIYSYISCETVLQRAGIIFQDYSHTYTLVSDNSLWKKIHGYDFHWRKIQDDIRTNPLGINYRDHIAIATPERAICDMLYLNPSYYFDAITNCDIRKLKNIITIYPPSTQKILEDRLNQSIP